MKAVFVDTFFFLALLNPADIAHSRAVAVSRSLRAKQVTTTWVLTEVGDAMSAPANRGNFVRFVSVLRNSSLITIVPASQEAFDSGFKLFSGRADKGWTLTDCISFVTMYDRAITDALTGDQHFVQAGFKALLT